MDRSKRPMSPNFKNQDIALRDIDRAWKTLYDLIPVPSKISIPSLRGPSCRIPRVAAKGSTISGRSLTRTVGLIE